MIIVNYIFYFGKRNTMAALTPISAFEPLGAARLNLGPITNWVFCLPKLVTALMVGLNQTLVDFAAQFWDISKLQPMPAPLFQL